MGIGVVVGADVVVGDDVVIFVGVLLSNFGEDILLDSLILF
jgi:serine acetyltransferase